MRFRAVLTDNAAMKIFLSTVTGLSKISKECVMRILPRNLYFIIPNDDTGPRRPLVWCKLPIHFYFREFNCEGVSEEHNEIYLNFATTMLVRSLSSIKQNAKSLKIKLTNKHTPCLTLEIEQAVNEGLQTRQVVHDIPVEVILRQNWDEYAEPIFNNFHVSIEMPNLRTIKNIVERMKNMSNLLTVSATKNGRLTLQIKTNVVRVSAYFSNLGIQSFSIGTHDDDIDDTEPPGDTITSSESVSATIDSKKFLMFLTAIQLNRCQTTCSIVQGKMVKLTSTQPDTFSVQCFFTEMSI
ncbi:hypothetical protein FQA39_LY07873 [Lamprigera yunnana]|nr:hypothetical protein FQA39_LY07873 [Lamprigera yunnana]